MIHNLCTYEYNNYKNYKKKIKNIKITAELILAQIEEVPRQLCSTFLGPVNFFLLRLVNSFCTFMTL